MRRATYPKLTNMKDQYFIIWTRSNRVKQWQPINIISGSEAAKNLKKVTENDIAKAVGVSGLAEGQIVKAIGMSLYEKKDEVEKEAKKMHPRLNYATELTYGFKEITNNTNFNKNPGPFLQPSNISIIPPEAELRNLLDEAKDFTDKAGANFAKVGDNVKGFFSSSR